MSASKNLNNSGFYAILTNSVTFTTTINLLTWSGGPMESDGSSVRLETVPRAVIVLGVSGTAYDVRTTRLDGTQVKVPSVLAGQELPIQPKKFPSANSNPASLAKAFLLLW